MSPEEMMKICMKERDLCIDCEDGFKDEEGLCVEDTGPDMSHKLVQCPVEERFDNFNICAEAKFKLVKTGMTS